MLFDHELALLLLAYSGRNLLRTKRDQNVDLTLDNPVCEHESFECQITTRTKGATKQKRGRRRRFDVNRRRFVYCQTAEADDELWRLQFYRPIGKCRASTRVMYELIKLFLDTLISSFLFTLCVYSLLCNLILTLEWGKRDKRRKSRETKTRNRYSTSRCV